MTLSQQHCEACHSGAQKLSPAQASAMLAELNAWQLSAEGDWLSKSYTFKNFALALAFVNQVSAVAEAENHHPDIEFGWGYVHLKLQTHAIAGLHENDFILAAKIDAL